MFEHTIAQCCKIKSRLKLNLYVNPDIFLKTFRALEGRPVYLVAATLRPETMYGQTNCWLHPTIKYIAYPVGNGEVFISTRRSARNMSYQGMTVTEGQVDVIAEFPGQVGLI